MGDRRRRRKLEETEMFKVEHDDKVRWRHPSPFIAHLTNLVAASSLVEELVGRESLGLDQEDRRRRHRPVRGESEWWEALPLSLGKSGGVLRRAECLPSGAAEASFGRENSSNLVVSPPPDFSCS